MKSNRTFSVAVSFAVALCLSACAAPERKITVDDIGTPAFADQCRYEYANMTGAIYLSAHSERASETYCGCVKLESNVIKETTQRLPNVSEHYAIVSMCKEVAQHEALALR